MIHNVQDVITYANSASEHTARIQFTNLLVEECYLVIHLELLCHVKHHLLLIPFAVLDISSERAFVLSVSL